MSREELLDSVYHTIANELERIYRCAGTCSMRLNIGQYSDKELDQFVWEAEEETGLKITEEEMDECFADAVHYIDSLYQVSDIQKLQDDLFNTDEYIQCL